MANELNTGTRIYYTGDMANLSATGTIVDIERDARFGDDLVIEWDADEDGNTKSTSRVSPCQFRPGPGRRFMTLAEHRAARSAQIAGFMRSIGKAEADIAEYLRASA